MMNDERGLTMTTTRLAIAALVTVGLAGAPFASEGTEYELKQDISTMQSDTSGTSGMSTTRPGAYGTSGTSVGTVTAPSVGSYYWPSVGVTNAVPTWSNTSPPVRR
jgi:hypothetical protein